MTVVAIRPFRFTPVSIRSEGNTGPMRSGYRIECCKCGEGESLPFNKMAGISGDNGKKLESLVARKFQGHGWVIGRNSRQDTCIKCAVAGRTVPDPNISEPKHQPQLTLVEKTTMKPTNAAPYIKPAPQIDAKDGFRPAPAAVTTLAPAPQPEPTMKDTLTIMAALQDHYIDKDKGYDRGWSDQKLAESLNCPRAWVKAVRVQFYGDGASGNEDITEALKEAKSAVKVAAALLENADRNEREAKELMVQAAVIRARVEAVHKTVHAIEQALT
jgi:hypothetical protein